MSRARLVGAERVIRVDGRRDVLRELRDVERRIRIDSIEIRVPFSQRGDEVADVNEGMKGVLELPASLSPSLTELLNSDSPVKTMRPGQESVDPVMLKAFTMNPGDTLFGDLPVDEGNPIEQVPAKPEPLMSGALMTPATIVNATLRFITSSFHHIGALIYTGVKKAGDILTEDPEITGHIFFSMIVEHANIDHAISSSASFQDDHNLSTLGSPAEKSANSDVSNISMSMNGPGGEMERSAQDIICRTLSDGDMEAIHQCWCDAFSDYTVPYTVSKEQMEVRLRQDGFRPELSVAAFLGTKMIGFWLSGIRIINGILMAYDAGTAVIKQYRGRGISSKLYQMATRLFLARGVKKYIIEVFIKNTTALKMYRRKGYESVNVLEAFQGTNFKPDVTNQIDDLEVLPASLDELRVNYSYLLDYEPSWQNSWEALKAVEDSVIAIKIARDGNIVGYAIYQPILRRFAHIAVAESEIEDLVMNALLSHFAPMLPQNQFFEIVNIPEGRSHIPELLKRQGFTFYESLYELVKDI